MVEGDLHDISTASVCCIITRVTRSFSRLTDDVIRFPVNLEDVTRSKQGVLCSVRLSGGGWYY